MTVHGVHLDLVPEGAGENVHFYAANSYSQTVPESGVLEFAPLAIGKYEIASRGRGVLGRVDVQGPVDFFVLDDCAVCRDRPAAAGPCDGRERWPDPRWRVSTGAP